MKLIASLTALTLLTAAPSFATNEGCTPGYWKNHLERWDGIGGNDYTRTVRYHMPFNSVFGVSSAQSGLPYSATLRDAVRLGGGGLMALNRHAAAGLASADSVAYGLSVGEVLDLYRDAVGAVSGPATVNSALHTLSCLNEAGCPLSNCGPPPPPPQYFCVADQGDCPCGNDSLLAGCRNSSGVGARLEIEGSRSVATDDFTLIVTQLPPSAPVLMLMSQGSSRVVFGDGLLCIAGLAKIFRLPPILQADAEGHVVGGPGYVGLSTTGLVPVPGGIQAGDTWSFQAFYRDMGPCGSGFNTSNGVSLTFVP